MARSRAGRLLLRLTVAAIALVTAAAAAAVWLLPRIVEDAVVAAIADAGVPGASVSVDAVGWRVARLSDLRVGDDLAVARIDAHYTLDDLRAGRVRRLDVSGVRLDAAVSGGGVSLGALDPLLRRRPGASGTAVPAAAVTLRDVEIRAATPAGPVVVYLAGEAERRGARTLALDASLSVRAPHGTANGTLALTAGLDGAYDARLDIAEASVGLAGIAIGGTAGSAALSGGRGGLARATATLTSGGIATPIGRFAGGALDVVLEAGRLTAHGSVEGAGGGFGLAVSGRVEDVGRPGAPFALEATLAADPEALRRYAPGGAASAGEGRATLSLSGALPDPATIDDLAATTTAAAIAGALDLELRDVTLPGVVRGLTARGRIDVTLADGALGIETDRGLRVEAAGLDAALLDAWGLPAPARRHLDGPLSLATGSTAERPLFVHVRRIEGGIGVAATVGARARLAGGAAATGFIDGTAEVTRDGRLARFSVANLELATDAIAIAGVPLALEHLRGNLAGTGDAAAGEIVLRVAAGAATVGGVDFGDARIDLEAGLDYRDGRLAATLRPSPGLRAEGLHIAGAVATGEPVRVNVLDAGDPAIVAEIGAEPVLRHRVAVALPATRATLSYGGTAAEATVEAPRIVFDGTLRWPGGAYAGTAELSGAAVALAGPALTVEDLDASLDLGGLRAGDGRFGRFVVGALRHGAEPRFFAPVALEGTVDRDGAAFAFALHARDLLGRAGIDADGRYDPATGGVEAEVALRPVLFAPDGLQPHDLVPALPDAVSEVAGTLAAEGRVGWRDGALASDIEVLIEDAALSAGPARLELINAVIAVDGLWPPSTPPGQVMAIGLFDAGLPLTDGIVTFRARPDGILEVESARWAWAGGTLRTALTFDPTATEHVFAIVADDLDLARIAELADIGDLAASGRVSGTVPVILSEAGLAIRDGRLEAAPGGGVLRYAPTVAPAALRRAGEGATLMLGALENFEYERLRLTVDRETSGETDIGFHLRGANPSFYDGYPVEFNLTISGKLDEMLRRGLEGYRVPDAIRERIQGFGE